MSTTPITAKPAAALPLGNGQNPSQEVALNLGPALASYAYYYGHPATPQENEGKGHGTFTLYQQQDGERQYYIKTSPIGLAPVLSNPFTLELVHRCYHFDLAPLD